MDLRTRTQPQAQGPIQHLLFINIQSTHTLSLPLCVWVSRPLLLSLYIHSQQQPAVAQSAVNSKDFLKM